MMPSNALVSVDMAVWGGYGFPPSLDRWSGVRVLWGKVIIRAVFDWVNYRDSNVLGLRKLADSAESWLFRPNETFNSFESLCLYLDIDAEEVRGIATTMTKDQVRKIEHMERTQALRPPVK